MKLPPRERAARAASRNPSTVGSLSSRIHGPASAGREQVPFAQDQLPPGWQCARCAGRDAAQLPACCQPGHTQMGTAWMQAACSVTIYAPRGRARPAAPEHPTQPIAQREAPRAGRAACALEGGTLPWVGEHTRGRTRKARPKALATAQAGRAWARHHGSQCRGRGGLGSS